MTSPAAVDILAAGYADLPAVASTIGLVRDDGAVIVVDPGMVADGSLIIDPLARLGVAPSDVTHVFVTHHHLDHTVNIALFSEAEVVDYRTVRRADRVRTHDGDGHRLSANTTIWQTPGHTPQDASLIVRTAGGLVAFTHLWWRADRTPDVDPYASDPEALAAGRRRLLAEVAVVVPGHGAPFTVR